MFQPDGPRKQKPAANHRNIIISEKGFFMRKSKKKILVIEQNPSLGFVFDTLLQNAFDAFIVTNPFDAMDVLSENEVNCIILSVEKRNTETHSLLLHLDSSKLLKTIPMVVLTDIRRESFRALYPRKKITKIFKKPFNPTEVLDAVHKICDNAEASSGLAHIYCIMNLN